MKPRTRLLLALNAAVALIPSAGQGKEMHLIWTAYMRNFPSIHAMVIDEIEHDRIVDVIGCNDAWCMVRYGRAEGYIETSALDGNIGRTALRGPLNPNAGCFWADQPAYVGLRPQEFCGVSANPPSKP